jgi:hypothetical protein
VAARSNDILAHTSGRDAGAVFLDCWQEQQGNQITTLNAFALEHVKQQAEVVFPAGVLHCGLAILSALIAFYSISGSKTACCRSNWAPSIPC